MKSKQQNLEEPIFQEEPLCVQKITMDRLLKCDKPTDCIALYMFCYNVAKWQGISRIKVTTDYCSRSLGISKNRIVSAKKQLLRLGFLEDTKSKKSVQVDGGLQ